MNREMEITEHQHAEYQAWCALVRQLTCKAVTEAKQSVIGVKNWLTCERFSLGCQRGQQTNREVMTMLYRGTIEDISGSWDNGLARITIKRPDGSTDTQYADNGPLIRNLESAYGNVITAGPRFDPTAVKGREIVYSTDSLLMEYFMPAEEYNGPPIPDGGLIETE